MIINFQLMQYILLEYADLISNTFLRHLMIISSDPDKK